MVGSAFGFSLVKLCGSGFIPLMNPFLFCFIERPLNVIQPMPRDGWIFFAHCNPFSRFLSTSMLADVESHSQIFGNVGKLPSPFLISKKPHITHTPLSASVHTVVYVEAETSSLCQKVNCFPAVPLAPCLPFSRCMNVFPNLNSNQNLYTAKQSQQIPEPNSRN